MSKTMRIVFGVWTFFSLMGAGFTGFALGADQNEHQVLYLQEGWNAFRETSGAPDLAAERAANYSVAEATLTRLTLSVDLPGMHASNALFRDGNVYSVVTAPGSGVYRVGGPNVPVFGTWILIPNGARAELETHAGRSIVYQKVELPPIQPPEPDMEGVPRSPFTKDEELYRTDSDYPGDFAWMEPTKTIRGQECTILWIYPFQYNPVRKTLSVYRDLTVTVRFDGIPSPLERRLRTASFDKMMRGMAPNADVVLALGESGRKGIRTPAIEGKGLSGADGAFGWDYIIISHTTFSSAAYKLAAWKEQIGFKVLTIISPSPTISEIYDLIRWCYVSLDIPPAYVLLIGDAEFIPCRYVTPHPWDDEVTGSNRQGYIGTDLYYAAIDGDDCLPDLAIGRLSVGSAADAMDHVDRIIEYEKDPPVLSTFYDDVAICAYFQDVPIPEYNIVPDGIEDSRYTMTSEDLAVFLSFPSYGINKNVTRIYYAKPEVNPQRWNDGQRLALANFGGGPAGDPGDYLPTYLSRPGFAWDGDYTDIKRAFEEGTFLITHRDHGGRQHWVEPYFHSFHLADLQIRWGESPVVWSVDCKTGWFDNETDYPYLGDTDYTGFHEESFVEFLESYCDMGGPVGVIGATRVTDAIYNDRLMWGWTDAIWPGFIPSEGPLLWFPRMGDVLNAGKFYMNTKIFLSDWSIAHFEMYHWFGDPSMEIRTSAPGYLEADHPTKWPWRNKPHDFKVHVQRLDGSPVWLARVTVSRSGVPSDQRVGWTDLKGDIVFADLVVSQLGEYTVTAVCSNTVPYVGTFQSEECLPSWLTAILELLW